MKIILLDWSATYFEFKKISMIVMKFGGSSVASADAIRQVIKVVEARTQESSVCVVVSAMGGVTDMLLRAAKEASEGKESYKEILELLELRHLEAIRALVPARDQGKLAASIKFKFTELENVLYGLFLIRELSKRSLDFILAFGERLSATLIASAFTAHDLAADFLDAREIIVTDEGFGSAIVDKKESFERIVAHFQGVQSIQVVTGFVAGSKNGHTTTLGRGGSDYTASLLGAALKAERIEIFTDVSGVLSADPRKVPDAHPIPVLSYEEAMEMSHFGAKVIYPPTMQPAMDAGIPLMVKNTFKPQEEGTIVNAEGSSTLKKAVKGISSIDDVCLINVKGSGLVGVSGVAARIFNALAQNQVNIILITQASSEHAITVAVRPEDAKKAALAIDETFGLEITQGKVSAAKIDENHSIIAVVGDHMRQIPGLAGQVFSALGRNGINIRAIAQGSSERNISSVIEKRHEAKALRVLHDAFFLGELKTVPLFLAGPGMIGSKVLEMLHQQLDYLKKKYRLDFRLVGISRSSSYCIDPKGIDMAGWLQHFDQNKTEGSITDFCDRMIELDLANSIFVDCSSSEQIAEQYQRILTSSISIATPNKKAASSSTAYFKKLHETARAAHAKYHYETNVGAGLPMIHTIRDLINTGDEVQRIEGVFSGTLSYLFNSFDGSMPFSSLVAEARKRGFTEPDPRDDLNGMDMARKILILAREAGFEMELSDIQVESLVPDSAATVQGVDAFLEILSQDDSSMLSRYEEAQKKGLKLCYLASFDGKKAKVGLQSLDASHPFFGLQAMDNIMAVYSNHYDETPLVVRGPGAGAFVTAGGVIADILRIADSTAVLNHGAV